MAPTSKEIFSRVNKIDQDDSPKKDEVFLYPASRQMYLKDCESKSFRTGNQYLCQMIDTIIPPPRAYVDNTPVPTVGRDDYVKEAPITVADVGCVFLWCFLLFFIYNVLAKGYRLLSGTSKQQNATIAKVDGNIKDVMVKKEK